MQYYFKGGKEHPIERSRHGNSKRSQTEYVRTWESTKDFLEKALQGKPPRDAVSHVVSKDLGGISSCVGVGQLPRSRQQSSDLKRNRNYGVNEEPNSKNISGKRRVDDPWYLLFNEAKKQSKDKKSAFVRDVRVANEPLCVLATDRQLNDLKRFCCNETEFRPFSVDPTFDIGQFNVTPISYEHLLLKTKRDGKHPTLIGPVLVHERKTEETYSTFASSLRTIEPDLSSLMAFGTDDEKALANAFNNNFQCATHLLCEVHLKKNVESKLVDLGIKEELKDEITADIFGKLSGDIFESGLSDASNVSDFEQQMKLLKQKWCDAHDKGAEFYEWFLKNKAKEFVESVIHPVRERAGLGCPPERFTTNRSERTNGVIQDFVKQKAGGKVDEYVFAQTLKELIDTQEQEIELAVVDKGEYKLREAFQHIRVSPSRWGRMTELQRKSALKKVHTVNVEERSNEISAISQSLQESENPLLQRFAEVGVDWIARDVLFHIVNKAAGLEEKLTQLPGTELETFVVPSSSNPKKPHVVVFMANGKCECQDCPGYSSLSICAHAVAVSLKLQRLDAYLKWLVTKHRKTGGVSYSRAITYGMPKGRGRKPNQAP